MSVTNNLKKPEDCSEANIKQQMTNNTDCCLALSKGEFDKQILVERREWETSVKYMKGRGIDVAKLLQEERAKLR